MCAYGVGMEREMSINDARPALGSLVDDSALDDTITYLTRRGRRFAAIVPLDRIATTEEPVTTTTTLARSSELSYPVVADGWISYIDGGDYNEDQTEVLVDALIHAQRDEVEKRLPSGCYWSMHTSEIIGPVGTEIDLDLDGRREDPWREVMEDTAETVAERFADIERATLGEPAAE